MYDIWRMQAVNDLQTLNAKRESIINVAEQIAELEAKYTAIRSATADSTPVRGGGSGREHMMLNNITERDRLQDALSQAKKDVAKIERALNVLTDEERRILQVRFIDREPGAVTKLSCELNLDERTVRNRQADALLQFGTAMRGPKKS